MARYLISYPAQEDLRTILEFSAERWGLEGRRRYAGNLKAAMQRVAQQPNGPNTRHRDELASGLRSFHIRHARGRDPKSAVREPVHILYYRSIEIGLVEIVRVLHERMEPARHLGSSFESDM